jgi:hypothetical protein
MQGGGASPGTARARAGNGVLEWVLQTFATSGKHAAQANEHRFHCPVVFSPQTLVFPVLQTIAL